MAKKSKLVHRPSTPPYHLLRPFVGCVVLALLFVAPQRGSNGIMALVKMSPIVCLGYLVLQKEALARRETKITLAALFFSLIGDFYLVWPKECFLKGVLSFWAAQALYIASFGFKRVSWKSGIAVYSFMMLCLVLALEVISSPPEKIAVTFYAFTLNTMLWRATDRALLATDLQWERRIFGITGAIIFCVSDLCIALLQVGQTLPHLPAQLIILSTYYLAQVLIVLSICERFWNL